MKAFVALLRVGGGVAVFGRGVNRGTAYGIGGAALVAVGAALIVTGDRKKNGTHASIGLSGVALTQTLRF